MLFQGLARPGRLHLVQMSAGVLDTSKGRNNSRSRLLPNGGNAGNIVRSVAHQRFHIDKFRRRHLVLGLHVLGIIVVDLRASPAGLGDPDFDVRIRELQEIPVSGYHGHFHACRLAALCHGSQDVIGLIALQGQNGNPHGRENFLHQRHLFPQFLRHGLSRPLVIPVHLVPERRSRQVKGHSQMIRLLFLQNLKHNIEEAVHRIGVKPLRIGQIRNPVKGPV